MANGINIYVNKKYDQFLKTELWKQTSESVFAKAGGQCERCGGMEGPFQAHHLTYKAPNRQGTSRSIPRGWLPDFKWLVCLDLDCHRFLHRLSPIEQFWETRALYQNHQANQPS
jgi:hypothetical protein